MLLTAGCRSSEAPFSPQQGEWTASNFTLTSAGCNFLAEEDEALFDPSNPGSLSQDYQTLLECSENGPGNTPGFDWVASSWWG